MKLEPLNTVELEADSQTFGDRSISIEFIQIDRASRDTVIQKMM